MFGLVVVLAGIAKLAGLAKELAVAAEFGVGPRIDAYVFVFNLLSTPTSIWFGAIFATLTPLLIRLERTDPESALRLRSQFFTISLIAGLFVSLAWTCGVYAFVSEGWSGLTDQTGRYALQILPLMAVMIPLLFVAHFGASCLMARNRHANSLYEGLPALVIVIAVLAYPPSIMALAIATAVGFALQMAATLASTARAGSLHLPSRPDFGAWRSFWPGFGVMLGVQALQSSSPMVDQLYAAQLAPGSLATFNYAFRIFAMFLTLAALALPRVLLPALATIAHDREATRRFMFRWGLLLGMAGVLVAVVTSTFSTTIVGSLFQRGAFTATDTIAVAQVLTILIWQLPFYLLSLLYSQQHYSNGKYGVVALISAGMLVIKLTIGLWLVWQFGLVGLAASGIAVFAFQALALYIASKSTRKKEVVEIPAA
ncbi:murein biosynthesis integral membrane protein MurJ [Leptolyngbya sp. 7M]|uniref:murein biosynthesis integral membrane protein MurJ n=1 Tax=Leptolyngbya sp. 7M TaxID=2812896 RepID=UPI001B8A8E70|nr:lipid II flippase MurJ [Leptolyngbya sp. 7M]QYO63572.1 hypothetical protein JVX88_27380 [Leptolyngbya sp. 7M]QYU69240.1 hypothetical protein J4558_03615 [Leptolyngbya sp. 15MV]